MPSDGKDATISDQRPFSRQSRIPNGIDAGEKQFRDGQAGDRDRPFARASMTEACSSRRARVMLQPAYGLTTTRLTGRREPAISGAILRSPCRSSATGMRGHGACATGTDMVDKASHSSMSLPLTCRLSLQYPASSSLHHTQPSSGPESHIGDTLTH
jgi:hypothetical protein